MLGYYDSWLAFQQRYRRVPGVQAAVLVAGEVVLSTAYGVADVATSTQLTTDHLFHVASHSKTFTATVVHQLVAAGRLRLDDSVGQWLPDLAGTPVAGVTVRALLAHGGGVVRDGHDGDFWALYRAFPDADTVLAVARDEGAVLPTNERFKYSNVGYSLLGLVIEAVTGRPYADVVREQVIDRLGLSPTGTGPRPGPRDVRRRAQRARVRRAAARDRARRHRGDGAGDGFRQHCRGPGAVRRGARPR